MISDRHNPNIVSVGIGYSYANVELPKVYDIIFELRNPDRYLEQKTVVKYAFNYRDFFHTDLWRGHHSHCLIEIMGEIPDLFKELPVWPATTFSNGIGLCTKYDWAHVKNHLQR